jgi:ribokinase
VNAASEGVAGPGVLVVGSINMDLVVRSARLPSPGETVTGNSLKEIPGGKGANQAVAAARLGGRVAMVGRVGSDDFAERLLDGLSADGINTASIHRTENVSSGVAVIGVEDSGQNSITVVPAANGLVSPDDIAGAESLFANASVLLLQLEIPIDAVVAAVRMARKHQVLTILDPAPAVAGLPEELLNVDVLCPNETEAGLLTGLSVSDPEEAKQAALQLRAAGARRVAVTLGENGVMLCDQDNQCELIPACKVEAIDTTAAGDCFAGALGVKLAEGASFRDAARFACAAAALAAAAEGAQPGMPGRSEVERLMRSVE